MPGPGVFDRFSFMSSFIYVFLINYSILLPVCFKMFFSTNDTLTPISQIAIFRWWRYVFLLLLYLIKVRSLFRSDPSWHFYTFVVMIVLWHPVFFYPPYICGVSKYGLYVIARFVECRTNIRGGHWKIDSSSYWSGTSRSILRSCWCEYSSTLPFSHWAEDHVSSFSVYSILASRLIQSWFHHVIIIAMLEPLWSEWTCLWTATFYDCSTSNRVWGNAYISQTTFIHS